MHLSTIARHLGLSLLLASLLPAQDQVRAVAPAHSPSSGNRFLSPGVDTGDYLYISGQGPRRADGTTPPSPDAQFRQALDNVKAVVESAGLTLDNVVYVQVYLTDIGSYSEMNRVFGEYFPKTPPARAVLGVYALPDPPVQINAVAVRNLDGRKAVYPANSSTTESASPGILTHDRLFISSMAGIDPATGKVPDDPAAQVDLALDGMQAVVKAAGLEMSHVVFVNPLSDVGHPFARDERAVCQAVRVRQHTGRAPQSRCRACPEALTSSTPAWRFAIFSSAKRCGRRTCRPVQQPAPASLPATPYIARPKAASSQGHTAESMPPPLSIRPGRPCAICSTTSKKLEWISARSYLRLYIWTIWPMRPHSAKCTVNISARSCPRALRFNRLLPQNVKLIRMITILTWSKFR